MNHKILIILPYYERPWMVRNALKSILKCNEYYKHWELAFIDDGSSQPGQPIVEKILRDHLDKVTFYQTHQTVQDKIKTGGLLGKYDCLAIQNSDADIMIPCSDDDALYPDALKNLNEYFKTNKDTQIAYSNIFVFNPLIEKPEDGEGRLIGPWNEYGKYVEETGKLDISQMAMRINVFKEYNYWPPHNKTVDVDWEFGRKVLKVFPAHKSGFVSAYKGFHAKQLTIRAQNYQKLDGNNWKSILNAKEAWNIQNIDKCQKTFL